MKTNLRERLTRYQSFIRPKVRFVPEFSFKWFHFIPLTVSGEIVYDSLQ